MATARKPGGKRPGGRPGPASGKAKVKAKANAKAKAKARSADAAPAPAARKPKPAAKPRVGAARKLGVPAFEAGTGVGLWPAQIGALYGIPGNANAGGQCIGVIAMGGGYLADDLRIAAQRGGVPQPVVIDVAAGGAVNAFGGGSTADYELALDLQVLAGTAPGARLAVYFAGDNIATLGAALLKAATDDVNRPQVVSISWGSPEKFWSDKGRADMAQAVAAAKARGMTVVAATGDNLATCGVPDAAAHVYHPASHPDVLACGGTAPTLAANGAAIAQEVVWNAQGVGTGGGISDWFAVPPYQQGAAIPPSYNAGRVGRGLPDVAGAASLEPGYRIVFGGDEMVKDGTSAATPLWASIVALANARRGRPVGFVNTFLYSRPQLFRPILSGNNRVAAVGYDARAGWNACTGLGAPKAADIIAALAALP